MKLFPIQTTLLTLVTPSLCAAMTFKNLTNYEVQVVYGDVGPAHMIIESLGEDPITKSMKETVENTQAGFRVPGVTINVEFKVYRGFHDIIGCSPSYPVSQKTPQPTFLDNKTLEVSGNNTKDIKCRIY